MKRGRATHTIIHSVGFIWKTFKPEVDKRWHTSPSSHHSVEKCVSSWTHRTLYPTTLLFFFFNLLFLIGVQLLYNVALVSAVSWSGDRVWDGWMASPTQWTWVWANSERRWRTGNPGVLQSMGSRRVRRDWVTKQQTTVYVCISSLLDLPPRLFHLSRSSQSTELSSLC